MIISSAAKKIADAALQHFADKGFDVGSLNAVADIVGIKKATIYSHFKNKDELFLYVFNDAIKVESTFVSVCFANDKVSGEHYLEQVSQRYHDSDHLRLLLRTAFISPEGLRQQVASGYESFLANIKLQFIGGLPTKTNSDHALLADAYLGIVDSVHVELLYATPYAAEMRRKALWHLLLKSISNQ